MLGGTMKNLQQILKQSSFIVCTTTTTHIRTISSGSRGAVAAKNFRLLLPQQDKQQQHHGGGIILGAPCHTKPSAVVGETIKRLLHHHRVSVPCINTSTTTTGKRGFCSVVGDHTTREITVKNSSVGRIIGKGGQTVRGIEMDSGANIHISDRDEFDSTRDRLITITGSSEQIEHAVKLIEEVPRVISQVGVGLDEQNQNYSGGPSAIINVSDSMAGFLIGRGGERKKRMEQQSGARINIAQRNDESNDGERMVAISGGNEQVELALKLINEAMAHEGTANDGILEHSGDNFAVKKMSVSHNMVGMIIGVGAENLRYLESKSGADIRLPRGELASGTRDRVVIISGSPEQVQLAQELIEEELIKEEHGLSASDGDVERAELRVKDDVAGFLIGHRGETLAEIRQTSGARISILSKLETPDFAVTGERVVMISGTSEQIERAQDLIRTCLKLKERD